MKCGEPILVTVEEEEDIAAFANFQVESPSSSTPSQDTGVSTSASVSVSVATSGTSTRLSPAAAALVRSQLLDVSGLAGSGKHGHIAKGDILLALQKGTISPGSQTSSPPTSTAVAPLSPAPAPALSVSVSQDAAPVNDHFVDIPNSGMRKVIAKRLTESKATVPHFYTSMECSIDSLLHLRKELKQELDINVSVNDIVIKSAAMALRDVPEANGKWDGSSQVLSDSIDISVAVATPTGLITPIVTDADKRGMTDINNTVKDLATRAKAGKLAPEEYQGGSFTISNLGMFGIDNFTAVINPPQACILAIGGGISRVLPPSPGASQPRVGTTMTVQLSSDRRVVDEAVAAQFLQSFSKYISNPKTILL